METIDLLSLCVCVRVSDRERVKKQTNQVVDTSTSVNKQRKIETAQIEGAEGLVLTTRTTGEQTKNATGNLKVNTENVHLLEALTGR